MEFASFFKSCLVTLVLTSSWVPITSAVDVTCPAVTTSETHKDFQSADTCYYFFSDQGVEASASSAKCVGMNLTLVMPKTQSEQTEIQDLLMMGNSFGIGLSRTSGSWTWEDGTALADTSRFQSDPGATFTFAETNYPGNLNMVQPNGYVKVMCQYQPLGGATTQPESTTNPGQDVQTTQGMGTQTTSGSGSTEATTVAVSDCTGTDRRALFKRGDFAPMAAGFETLPVNQPGLSVVKLSCARMCTQRKSCTYFRFRELTGECGLSSAVTGAAGVTEICQAGFTCYQRTGDFCP